MKAAVTKENLKKVLNLVSHIAASTSTLPILSNILLQTDKGRLKISATNLEIGLTAWLGGRIEEDGSLTLPAKTVNEYIATMLGEQIMLETNKSALQISTETSKASLKTLPPEEFPLIPQFESGGQVFMPAGELKNALSEVIFAAAPQETQPELSGIFVHSDGSNLYFVATDRYRLTERSTPLSEVRLQGEFKSILIPYRTAQEAVRLLSSLNDSTVEVGIMQGENQVLFKMPDLELVSRLVDGQFPDYKQVIPKEFSSQAKLARYDLMQAVKSAGLFASTTRSVKLTFKSQEGLVEVSAASGDLGESTVKISGEVSGQSQENTFNYKYLLDYLGNIPDEMVIFKTINDSSPAIIVPSERTNNVYMVMPIKA